VINNLHRQETTQIVGLMLIFLAMAISLYALFQFLTASDYTWQFLKPEGYRKRGSGTFICPNNLAGYLGMILPLSLAFTLTGRIEHLLKVFLAYASLAIFTGITVTLSRGGWLSMAVSLAVLYFWLVTHRHYRKQALIGLGIFVVIFAVFYWKADMPPNRYERIVVAHEVEDVRFRLWGPAVAMWKDHLWFGVGPAHFDTRFPQYRPADPELQGRPERAHNDYLNTLADWGLVGGVLVLACWGVFYWQVFRGWKFVQRTQNDLSSKRSNKAAFVLGGAVGLLAILAHSVVDFNMHIPANAILAVTILALVSAHYRFASERWWHTVRWPLRVPVYLVLATALIYLAPQSWRRTAEVRWLSRADDVTAKLGTNSASSSPDRLAALGKEQLAAMEKAAAVDPRNFETAYALGEVLRQQSFAGLDGYQALAERAMIWFDYAQKLNPYLPYASAGYGMCLDWLGRSKEAEAYFKRAEQLDPNGARTLAYVGWHYFQVRDYPTAKKWFEWSLRLSSDPKINPMVEPYLKLIKEKLEGSGAAPNKPEP
jgi:O-antigen ligase